MKRCFVFLFLLLIPLSFFAQNIPMSAMERTLVTLKKRLDAASPETCYVSLAPAFRKELETALKQPDALHYPFDSLSKFLSIVKTTDGKARFFSYDENGGGTWHNIASLVQFKNSKGQSVVQWLSTGREGELSTFTDSGVYEEHDIDANGKKYYVCFASGTHGAGNQHRLIRAYTMSGDTLRAGKVFDQQDNITVEFPRVKNMNLLFDPGTKTISYNEFAEDEDSGFNMPTGKRVNWVWKNGVFVKQ